MVRVKIVKDGICLMELFGRIGDDNKVYSGTIKPFLREK